MPRKILGTGLDLSGQKIINLGDPSANNDAVNKQYVDALMRGFRWKEPARAASTANVTLASPGATLDGVTLVSGDRILLKNQTTGSQNGVYVWTGAAVALTRANDADTANRLTGATVMVLEGTTNGDKAFTQTADSVNLETTPLVWSQIGGGSAAYTAGLGLSLSGSDFNIGAGTGITVNADNIQIDSSLVVRKFAQSIGNGSATSIAVTHNLGTKDVTYSIQNASTGEFVDTDVTATDTNTLTFVFAVAPTSGQYRVVVHG